MKSHTQHKQPPRQQGPVNGPFLRDAEHCAAHGATQKPLHCMTCLLFVRYLSIDCQAFVTGLPGTCQVQHTAHLTQQRQQCAQQGRRDSAHGMMQFDPVNSGLTGLTGSRVL